MSRRILYLSRRNWANCLWEMPVLVRNPTGSIPFSASESLFFFFLFVCRCCCFGCSVAEHKTLLIFLGKRILFGPFGDWNTKTELFVCRENLVGNEREEAMAKLRKWEILLKREWESWGFKDKREVFELTRENRQDSVCDSPSVHRTHKSNICLLCRIVACYYKG